jgi:hypothetical protein
VLLPISYRYVAYNPERAIDPNVAVSQDYIKQAVLDLSQWVNRYVPEGVPISTDHRGFFNLYSVHNFVYGWNTQLDFMYDSQYLFLHYFTLRYGLYVQLDQVNVTNPKTLIDGKNIVYNDADGMLLKK